MQLLDELIQIGEKIPPSHLVSSNTALQVLSALVHHVAHGEEFLKIARKGEEELRDFFGNIGEQPADQQQARPPENQLFAQTPSEASLSPRVDMSDPTANQPASEPAKANVSELGAAIQELQAAQARVNQLQGAQGGVTVTDPPAPQEPSQEQVGRVQPGPGQLTTP